MPAVYDEEAAKVESWRLERLLEAGFPLKLASPLATRPDVDYRAALALLDRGCSTELAFEILY